VSASADVLSSVCDREATTIEPLVKGQQLIAVDGASDGIANSLKSRSVDRWAACFAANDLWLALQHACEPIDAETDIESPGADDSAALIDARA